MPNRTITFDAHEIDQLAVDFSKAGFRMNRAARRVTKEIATDVEVGMRKDATGHRYLPKFAKDVSKVKLGELSWEIGWRTDGRRQGSLAHIIVFGSVNNAPVYDHRIPLRRAEPRFVRRMADVAEDAVFHDPGRS